MIDSIVTGGSGFIGRKLVKALESRGEKVMCLSSKNFDITKKYSWENLPKAKNLFHLASKSFVPDSWNYRSNIFETNVLGTKNALDYSKRVNSNLIFASSYIYGIPINIPVMETDLPKPNNPYALSKYFSEQLGSFYAQYENINVTSLRIFNVFGPGQDKRFLIPSIIEQLKEKIIRVKDLEPKRDYIYIDDVVRAFLYASKRMQGFNIFNIGSGESYSVKEVINNIQLIAGTNIPILSEENKRNNEIPNVIADTSKTEKFLNWSPIYSFKKGLEETVKKN